MLCLFQSIKTVKTRGNGPTLEKDPHERADSVRFFLESFTDFIRFGRSSGLLVLVLSSHTPMAEHSDIYIWASTFELTAAGLRRTLTGFPLGTLGG